METWPYSYFSINLSCQCIQLLSVHSSKVVVTIINLSYTSEVTLRWRHIYGYLLENITVQLALEIHVLWSNGLGLWCLTDNIEPVWPIGLLSEWEDAPANVPGLGQDCTSRPRDDPPLRVSDMEYCKEGEREKFGKSDQNILILKWNSGIFWPGPCILYILMYKWFVPTKGFRIGIINSVSL